MYLYVLTQPCLSRNFVVVAIAAQISEPIHRTASCVKKTCLTLHLGHSVEALDLHSELESLESHLNCLQIPLG